MIIVECCFCGGRWWKIKLYKNNKKINLVCKNCGYVDGTEF